MKNANLSSAEAAERIYCVRVTAGDMLPAWRPGETAMINPDEPVRAGDEVLVRFAGGGLVLRRLVDQDHATVTLATYAPAPPEVYDRRDVAALHFVCGRINARAVA